MMSAITQENEKKFDLKQRTTDKIENIVKSAVEQMPENATNIRLIEGYRRSIGAFGTTSCWTEVEAVYKDDDGHEVGRVKTIDKIGGWQYSEPANYILYHMGLYKPYNQDNLETIKGRYEWDLDHDMIYPINNIVSETYKIRAIKDRILSEEDGRVTLTFVMDYDHVENGFNPNVRYNKKEYSVKPRISYKDEVYTGADCKWSTGVSILLHELYDEFQQHGIDVTVDYDMLDEDWEFMTGHLTKWWEK